MPLASLTLLVLASALGVAACKKKDEAASTAGSGTRPADTAPAAAVTPPAAPPAGDATPPMAAGSAAAIPPGTIASDEDFVVKSSAAIEKMTEIFKVSGTNCDKLASEISKFVTENAVFLKDGEAYSRTHPDSAKKLDAATKDKMPALTAASEASLTACQTNPKVLEALQQLKM